MVNNEKHFQTATQTLHPTSFFKPMQNKIGRKNLGKKGGEPINGEPPLLFS
jgi:hypothetical protein